METTTEDGQLTWSALGMPDASVTLGRTSDAMLVTDDERRYVWVNAAACELLGLPREALLGRRIDDFVKSSADEMDRAWRQFLRNGRDAGTVSLHLPGGRELLAQFEATANIGKGLHGSVLRRLPARRAPSALLKDPPRNTANGRSRRLPPVAAGRGAPPIIAGQDAKRIGRLLGHELRGPLAAAAMQLHLAERQLATAEVRPTLAKISAQLSRLDALVTRLLEIDDSGVVLLRPESANLRDVVQDVVDRMCMAIPDARRRLLVVRSVSAPGHWDVSALEQIVSNLISNALKFGAGRPVEIGVEPSPPYVHLWVRDEGIGIPKAQHDRIFERGVRAPGTDHVAGSGLGLWLVERLVRAHGGEISVDSAPGQGTTMHVRLPA